MRVEKFNISKPKKYTDRDGNEKTQWNNIGMMTVFIKDDGSISRILEIPAIGLEANIFPFVKKEEALTAPSPMSQLPPSPMSQLPPSPQRDTTAAVPAHQKNEGVIPF